MKKKDQIKENRVFTEPEIEIFHLLGRFQRLVSPSRDMDDILQQVDYTKSKFTELQSLALERLYELMVIEIKQMSDHIAHLEMSSGLAKFAGEE